MGRPFILNDGTQLLAEVHNSTERSSWCDFSYDVDSVSKAELPASSMEKARERWLQDGRAEHASVASFSRFSLQLMAVAAPASLLVETHQAAIDEVKHAQLCFGLVSLFDEAHDTVSPGALKIPIGSVDAVGDIGSLVFHTALEGAVGETVSAIQALFELDTLPDGSAKKQVAKVLQTIFEDESRHAALAWRTLSWAVSQDSPGAQKAKEQLSIVLEMLNSELMSLSKGGSDLPMAGASFAGGPLSPTTKLSLRLLTLRQLIIPSLLHLQQGKAGYVLTSSSANISNEYVKLVLEQLRSQVEM